MKSIEITSRCEECGTIFHGKGRKELISQELEHHNQKSPYRSRVTESTTMMHRCRSFVSFDTESEVVIQNSRIGHRETLFRLHAVFHRCYAHGELYEETRIGR